MSKSLALWEGVDVEHMIVDASTLDVKPIAGRLLAETRGEGPGPGRVVPGQVDRGPVTWSNGLVLHVIGLKTTAPTPDFVGLATHFQESVGEIDGMLRGMDARLMPGGMHPWMDPERELRLWPHEHCDV